MRGQLELWGERSKKAEKKLVSPKKRNPSSARRRKYRPQQIGKRQANKVTKDWDYYVL